jgi:hypothetical protein
MRLDNNCEVIAVEFVSCDRDGGGEGDGATAPGEGAALCAKK